MADGRAQLLAKAAAVAAGLAAAYFVYRSLPGGGGSRRRRRDIPRRVGSITIFPVKSCKGIDVSEARISDCGFPLDRNWVLVTATGNAEKPWEIHTLRESPALALVETAIEFDDAVLKPGVGGYQDGGHLVLRAPGMQEARVRFPREKKDGDAPATYFMFIGDNQGLDEGDEVAKWFSQYLGKEVRLMVQDPDFVRPTLDRYTPPAASFETTSAFPDPYAPQTANSDAFPFMILSTASFAALGRMLSSDAAEKGQSLEAANLSDRRRFRANVVVDNGQDPAEAFEEDGFKRVALGGEEFLGTMNCTRCTVPLADPDRGVATRQPLLTLQKHRRGIWTLGPAKACFGVYAFAKKRGGLVHVGDEVRVLEWGPMVDAKDD
ncbi:MOSC N-terminal beta barrel domain-containing protein [Hyaloraphidium curvatum]|nr:MOSC N-terminal beta barrel domain-containing protein [Hyaloraphidium curvatum]